MDCLEFDKVSIDKVCHKSMYNNDKKKILKDIYVLFYVNYYSGNKMNKTMALN